MHACLCSQKHIRLLQKQRTESNIIAFQIFRDCEQLHLRGRILEQSKETGKKSTSMAEKVERLQMTTKVPMGAMSYFCVVAATATERLLLVQVDEQTA